MRICISIRVENTKKLEKLKPILDITESTPVEVNLTQLVKSEDFEKFIPLLAAELEDYLQDRTSHVKVLLPPEPGLIERLLNLLDYLNVERVVLKLPDDTKIMFDTVDEAARYGVKVIWKINKQHIQNVNELANEIAPYRLRLAMDVASRKSVKEFTKDMLYAGGYVEVIHVDNKHRTERGLPIFDERGLINYAKIFKVLRCIQYDKDIVLNYRPEYYGYYRRDVDLSYTVLHSLGSSVLDERTKRFIESVLREVMNVEY